MNSMLILKEKNDERVIYCYSSDVADFGGKIDAMVSDGEIECSLASREFKTLKTATHDDSGWRAKWLYPHVWKSIFEMGCPDRRFVATG